MYLAPTLGMLGGGAGVRVGLGAAGRTAKLAQDNSVRCGPPGCPQQAQQHPQPRLRHRRHRPPAGPISTGPSSPTIKPPRAASAPITGIVDPAPRACHLAHATQRDCAEDPFSWLVPVREHGPPLSAHTPQSQS